MRNTLPGTNRRQILWLGAICAIAFSAVTGLVNGPIADPGAEVLARLPVANQQIQHQVAAHMALRSQSPEQSLIQAADTFAVMRASGEEKLGGLIEQTLARQTLKTRLPAKLMLADLYQYQHRFDDALTLLVGVEDQASESHAYWRLRANLYRIGGQIQAMANACQRGAAIERSPWTVLCEAEIAALRGQETLTVKLLDTVASDYSAVLHSNADLLTWVADLFDRTGRTQQASAYLRKALLVAPGAYAVDRLIQFQLTHEGADTAERTLNWWHNSGLAPSAPWQLSAALIAAARGDRVPASRLLASLEAALSAHMRLPGATVHWRELARLSMVLEPASETSREYALKNWRQQKEPIDAALLAQAASAGGDKLNLDQLTTELHARDMSGLHADLARRGWL